MPTNPIGPGTCNISYNGDPQMRAQLHKKSGEHGMVLSELLRGLQSTRDNFGGLTDVQLLTVTITDDTNEATCTAGNVPPRIGIN